LKEVLLTFTFDYYLALRNVGTILRPVSMGRRYGGIYEAVFVLGVGLLAGTVIGAAAVTGLNAQAKPPVFLITEIDVSNPEAYGKEFAPKAQATIKAAGAKFVLIGGTGGASAKPITSMDGAPPSASLSSSGIASMR